LSEMYQVGASWRRYFRQGVAVVNPSLAALVVQLGGTYLNDGHPVSTINLEPASGAVLATSTDSATGK